MGQRLTPSALPGDAPEPLKELLRCAHRDIALYREAEQRARDARHEARQSVDRYETALLEHVGQLSLFGENEDG